MFYVVSYVLTTLGTFGLILYLSREGFESEEISDLAGLGKKAPWLAGVMAVFMLSLAGIPPFVGFYAKLAILQALITTNMTGHLVLAVVAVMFSLIGAFYYLRLIKVMFFDEISQSSPIQRSSGISTVLALNGAAVLLFGLAPDGLMSLCREAVIKALSS
jgi:NADH-quinone oxidoreductase subunit N